MGALAMQNLDIFGGASEPVEGKPREGYSAIELKAINWYATNNNCNLQLSSYPTITFIDRTTREEINENIKDVIEQYRSWKKEDTKERARQRRIEKQQAENGRGGNYGG